MKIDLMIFDFDGTLVDSGNDLATAVNHTLRTLGIPVLEKDRIIEFVGDGVRKLIERSLGDAFHDKFDEALDIFMSYYDKHLLDTTGLYPGVLETLDYFRIKKKVIVTNKLYSFTLKIAKGLKIAQYFDDIIGANSSPYKKPDPRVIRPLMKKYGVEDKRTVVIGDGNNDVLVAKNTGVLSCAMLNGLGNKDELLQLKPDYFCENIKELKNLFE
ncbi:MAG: HAD-IA family hydrolase [Syntrophobacterales bacterium]|nr:HAD-IA family hydrolase [Syntrophobacterales bacterium]